MLLASLSREGRRQEDLPAAYCPPVAGSGGGRAWPQNMVVHGDWWQPMMTACALHFFCGTTWGFCSGLCHGDAQRRTEEVLWALAKIMLCGMTANILAVASSSDAACWFQPGGQSDEICTVLDEQVCNDSLEGCPLYIFKLEAPL